MSDIMGDKKDVRNTGSHSAEEFATFFVNGDTRAAQWVPVTSDDWERTE